MGHAISSADLDSDHNLRNEKLSKIIEDSAAKATTEETKSTDDSASEKGKTDSKAAKSTTQTSKAAKATTEETK